MNRFALMAVLAALGASSVLADFSYEQTTKMTGGAMAGVMRTFSRQMREGFRTTVLIKGDRMASIGPQSAHIVDLAKETITEVNFERKTYSVITFAQMQQALQELQAKMAGKKGDQQMEITMKPSVKDGGQTRQISGMNAKLMLLNLEMEGTDKKSGEKRPLMNMSADMWIAPQVAGYQEVRSFYQRMAQKLNWNPNAGMFAAAQPGSAGGMSELYKEAAKLDGVPVLQIMRMGGAAGQPGAAGSETAQQAPPPQQQAEPQEKPSVGGALGRLGRGRFGGLGGALGRKRQEQEQAQPQQTQQQAPPPQQQQQAGPPSLMEMTTETTAFSSAPVDASKFEVPAGFKQVESETLKNMRR